MRIEFHMTLANQPLICVSRGSTFFHAPFLVALAYLFFFTGDSHAGQNYFVVNEKKSHDLGSFPKWTGMVERYGTQKNIPDEPCGNAQFHPCKIKEWKAVLAALDGKPLREQVEAVNRYLNSVPYVVDQINWAMQDYWATPHEFLDVDGDCEDYAIAKFYSLKMLGVPMDKMRIIILQDFNLGGIIHAVLGVHDGDDLLILDNQTEQVLPADRIYHYKPIYSLNESAWWAYYPK